MKFLAKSKSELNMEEQRSLLSLYGVSELEEGTYCFFYEARSAYLSCLAAPDGSLGEIKGVEDEIFRDKLRREIDSFRSNKPAKKAPEEEKPPVLEIAAIQDGGVTETPQKPAMADGCPAVSASGLEFDKDGSRYGPIDFAFYPGFLEADDFDGSLYSALTLGFASKEGGELKFGDYVFSEEAGDISVYVLDLRVLGVGEFSLLYLLKGKFLDRQKAAYFLSNSFKPLRKYGFASEKECREKEKALRDLILESKPLAIVYDSTSKVNRGIDFSPLFSDMPFPVLALREKDLSPKPEKAKKDVKPAEKTAEPVTGNPGKGKKAKRPVPYVLTIYRDHGVFALMLFLSSLLLTFALLLTSYLFMQEKGSVASSLIVCAVILFPINALLASSIHSYLVEDGIREKKYYYENFAAMMVLNVSAPFVALGLFFLLRLSGLAFLEAEPPASFYYCLLSSAAGMFVSPFFCHLLVPFVSSKEKIEESKKKKDMEGKDAGAGKE